MSEDRSSAPTHKIVVASAVAGAVLYVASFFPVIDGQGPVLFGLAVALQILAAVLLLSQRPQTAATDGASEAETPENPEEIARLRSALTELKSELETKNTEVERFTYIVSHDLRSPLLTIQGFSDILKMDVEEGKTEAIEEDLGHIYKATQRMRQLLDDLLELSRIGRFTEPAVEVALEEVATDALYEVRGLVEEKNGQVSIAIDLPTIKVDRSRIQQLFRILLDNAIRYGVEGRDPKVEVGWRSGEQGPELYVRDNGAGLEVEQLEKAFGPFERFSTDSVGTGMGLAHARRIAAYHQGWIRAESEGAGSGSTVAFFLQAPEEASPTPGS